MHGADSQTEEAAVLRGGKQRVFDAHGFDLAVIGERVAIAWKEFDGEKTRLRAQLSSDGGDHWQSLNPGLGITEFSDVINDLITLKFTPSLFKS